MAGQGHRRSLLALDRAAVTRAVAAAVGVNPRMTLQALADRLTALRLYPPRGGTHWSTSSVARILHDAR